MMSSGSVAVIGFFDESTFNKTQHKAFHRVSKLFRGSVAFAEAQLSTRKKNLCPNTLAYPRQTRLWRHLLELSPTLRSRCTTPKSECNGTKATGLRKTLRGTDLLHPMPGPTS